MWANQLRLYSVDERALSARGIRHDGRVVCRTDGWALVYGGRDDITVHGGLGRSRRRRCERRERRRGIEDRRTGSTDDTRLEWGPACAALKRQAQAERGKAHGTASRFPAHHSTGPRYHRRRLGIGSDRHADRRSLFLYLGAGRRARAFATRCRDFVSGH